MTDADVVPAAALTTRPARVLRCWGGALRRWWHPSGWNDALELVTRERERPATIAMFYAEIGALAERSGLSSDQDPKDLPALPPDWTTLSNSMVLTALQADRKFASGKAQDIKAGIVLLRQAIADAERRLAGLPTDEAGRKAAPGPDRDAARRTDAARHRISYYRQVLALLYVRLGRALERAGDAEAEAAFRTALVTQTSLMPYTAQEFARFLGGRGRFEEADQALRSTRSIVTPAAQVDMAQARAGIARSFVEGARKRNELRTVLPTLERNIADLARLRTGLGDADSDRSRELLGWNANATAVQGSLLAEIGEHRRAARAFEASLGLYAQHALFLPSVITLSELLGDEHVRLGALRAAAEAYANGVEQWCQRGRSEAEREQAKLLGGKHALAMLAIEDAKALGGYEAEFPGGASGPFKTVTEQADLLLALPDVANRFKLALGSRLRGAPGVAQARDRVFALRQLIGRAVPSLDFPEAEADAQTIRPWYESVRLELDVSLLGTVPDLGATLIARARKARERIQAEWGVVLPGIQVADSVGERRFRILIRGMLAEEGQIPAADAPAETSAGVAATAAPDGTLAPAAEQVFAALESCIAWNLVRLLGQTELWWMLERNSLLPAEGTVERFETESAAAMVALIAVVRRLVLQQVRLVAFPALYARFVAGRAADEAPDVIAAAIRRMPEVNARLWGSDPGAALFRLSSADAARLAAIVAAPSPAGGPFLRAFMTECAKLPAGACVVVPDPAIRGPLQDLVAQLRRPVLTDDEVPLGRLATAQRWSLAEPPPPDAAAAPAVADGSPPGPARRLRRLIEQEALRRGLSRATGRAVFRAAVAHRDEDFFYAAELALDPHGPEEVELRAGAAAFGALEGWAAAGGPDRIRPGLYTYMGVYVPPVRIRLDDTLPPEETVLGFNALREAMPPMGDQAAFESALTGALIRHLVAFLGNRQAERLLTRLNKEQPLLVANALERLGIPAIIGELRRLVAVNHSIRNLQLILDVMLIYHGRPDSECWSVLLLLTPDFLAT